MPENVMLYIIHHDMWLDAVPSFAQLLGWTDVQRAEDRAAGIDKGSIFIKIVSPKTIVAVFDSDSQDSRCPLEIGSTMASSIVTCCREFVSCDSLFFAAPVDTLCVATPQGAAVLLADALLFAWEFWNAYQVSVCC